MTGFPPGIVIGTQHLTDSIAAQAQLNFGPLRIMMLRGEHNLLLLSLGILVGKLSLPVFINPRPRLKYRLGILLLMPRVMRMQIWIFPDYDHAYHDIWPSGYPERRRPKLPTSIGRSGLQRLWERIPSLRESYWAASINSPWILARH